MFILSSRDSIKFVVEVDFASSLQKLNRKKRLI